MILWREEIECMPKGSTTDGLVPLEIEVTKYGVEVRGGIWFLLGGRDKPNLQYELNLCLSRAQFPSVESVTVDKLRAATISEATFEDGLLSITTQ